MEKYGLTIGLFLLLLLNLSKRTFDFDNKLLDLVKDTCYVHSANYTISKCEIMHKEIEILKKMLKNESED